jgi:polysaccharide export outer membrane protein
LHSNGSKVTIDLHALLAGDRTQNHAVTNGDVIVVPRAPMFYIYGEVQRPGSYKLEKNMSIAQAISAGGGLTAKGSESWPGPIVKRRDAEGKEQEIDVEGFSLLQADDVLYIKESWL